VVGPNVGPTDGAVRGDGSGAWDHSTRKEFFEYYAGESESEATLQRFRSVMTTILRVRGDGRAPLPLDVADVGCGAGTQARLWAGEGHRVHGVDINGPLIDLARERSARDGMLISFEVGSATALPWSAGSMDVCVLPELLEHVGDWRACLAEADRVLRPGGLLYLSTTNLLCPQQQEFNLPLYSWYPAPLKRYCERLSVTTHPALANHAKYPAVHWFTFYGLRDHLAERGYHSLDRFDLIDTSRLSARGRAVVGAVRKFALLRFLGHVATPSTYLLAVKPAGIQGVRS
jgi:2-polyprenyl-6-hydroxyphenyl methylase/3-demethylubiquinone-9 3-methyltransferase